MLLDTLRVTGRESLPGQQLEPWYDGWKGLWVTIEEKLSLLRAHMVATRFRLEMRQDYGAEQGGRCDPANPREPAGECDPGRRGKYAAEYRVAHHEAEEHGEHPTLWDIIRGLFLLPEETPEERMQRRARSSKRGAAVSAAAVLAQGIALIPQP